MSFLLLLGLFIFSGEERVDHTFSIAAVDPVTGEVGVAVTTRNPCVGNGVPWVRVGVGAVATQASTRTEYGAELLDLLEQGLSAKVALERALSADEGAERRQIGLIGLTSGSAQHTGSETRAWSGHRSGASYVTQGNLLVGPEVLEAVARSFEGSEGSRRHLADRLIAALEAGQAAGGDARKGRTQSAAVIVADPRDGHSRRRDGISTQINLCEHETPVAELRRVYDTISQSLGFRVLQQFVGKDVLQLQIILHALGYVKTAPEPGDDPIAYTPELVAAVDAFREAEGLSTPVSGSPPGLVDEAAVERLWRRLDEQGKAESVRERIREITVVTR
ncbi:MAG TPA: DUF1028 domain-containing protein [Vicinamibacteria bacterium]|nr:DUF1028 domain-containing protein [Vicinamibacteria bacterium]